MYRQSAAALLEIPPDVASSVQYEGSPAARQALQKQTAACDIMVASYETARADIEWMAQRQWLYCVLDEGHVIRNPKTKLTQVLLSGLSAFSSSPWTCARTHVLWVTTVGDGCKEQARFFLLHIDMFWRCCVCRFHRFRPSLEVSAPAKDASYDTKHARRLYSWTQVPHCRL